MDRPTLDFFSFIVSYFLLLSYCASLSDDGVILTIIRKGDWRDSGNALSTWNESDRNPCAWKGISCDELDTVTTVDLTGALISGNLTSAICSLPNLTYLTLQGNAFSALFPDALSNCKRLQRLDLSSNGFTGTLPTYISELSELRVLNLSYNAFSGSIPPALGLLPQIEVLLLNENNLSGAFPNFVGHLESLINFTIGGNPLRPGVIPRELGNLDQLQVLRLDNCSLVGGIPSSLGNLIRLEILDLSQNDLSGDIPTSLMALSNLRELSLFRNNLSGRIPANIGQLTMLSTLDLGHNQLEGTVPNAIGNLTYLNLLQLQDNRLTGKIPSQIGKLRHLSNLMLYNNSFSGWLPQSLGTYSNFVVSDVSNSGLEGPLPRNLCMGGVLYGFVGTSNNFNGTLPSFFGDCKSLQYLYLDKNQLSGEIPPGLWGAVKLEGLFLDSNKFQGKISLTIGQATNLIRLKISNNRFEGIIPPEVGQLKNLQVFEASNNQLSGPIPPELGSLSLLNILLLDHNFLSEEIPEEITSLNNLTQLNLGYNRLTGEIPGSFSKITTLDLSNNLLSGRVPLQLGGPNLNVFNVSNNHLSGRIPDGFDNPAYKESFLGNPKLCGGRNLILPSCSSSSMSPQRLVTILVPSLFILAMTTLSCIYLCRSSNRRYADTQSWKMTPFHSTEVDEAYILRNLRESNVIGSGGAGKVYKVILQNGQAVAVKKIRNMSRPGRNFTRKRAQEESKMGEVEVDTLGLIRHANILKLLCCISSDQSDFKLLVYEFMPNGSLFDVLHGIREPQVDLQWPIRYQIALGVARGLSYMHHDCSPPILHRDVKSSNILLDGDFGAKISDFGLSRELNKLGDEFTVSGYVGSHGYIAPEYANRLKVNEKSDVYSLGVVMLELVSGMKATGEEEYGEDGDIVDWIRKRILMGREEMAVFDDRMVADNCIEQMMRVLHLGLVCTNRVPTQRPSMRKVVERLVAYGGDKRKETFHHVERISSSDSDSDNEAVYFAETDL